MLFIPQVKKKITGFVKDENGTISKGNLIKGGILLGSIGASINIVDAFDLHPESPIADGSRKKIPKDSCFKNGGKNITYHCELDSPLEGTDPDTMNVDRTYCYSGYGDGILAGDYNRHNNSHTIVHRNAQQINTHRNHIGFALGTQDNLYGTHSHHGQHVNIDSVNADCGTTNHASACWHDKHSSGGWCL